MYTDPDYVGDPSDPSSPNYDPSLDPNSPQYTDPNYDPTRDPNNPAYEGNPEDLPGQDQDLESPVDEPDLEDLEDPDVDPDTQDGLG